MRVADVKPFHGAVARVSYSDLSRTGHRASYEVKPGQVVEGLVKLHGSAVSVDDPDAGVSVLIALALVDSIEPVDHSTV